MLLHKTYIVEGVPIFIIYKNYKNGINNLCAVFDVNGNYGSSLNGKKHAIKNYKRNVRAKKMKEDLKCL